MGKESDTPAGGGTHRQQKCNTDQASGQRVGAPGLEHEEQSNAEKDDGGYTEGLGPHMGLPM